MNRHAENYFLKVIILLTAGVIFFSFQASGREKKPPTNAYALSWPKVTMESMPWTRWWWMGSAVEKDQISIQLELLAGAGFGGVELTPIYGVKGWEDRSIYFLSPEWMEMFSLAASEADRLGMGFDMSNTTGWPFGGPQVEPENAAKKVNIRARISTSGKGIEYRAGVKGTGQAVKRAAPGGEGLVMDHYSQDALQDYLSRFDEAFTGIDARPRCFFNDSFEVYGSDWTGDFFEEFEQRRGYDLREHLGALAGRGDDDYVSRVKCDYQETVSDLLLEEFTIPWTGWTHGQRACSRNQAHGSPGNLLDLYAAADIPETEAFGPIDADIPGLEYFKTHPDVRGRPNPLVMKFASSAAHVSGRPLASSETFTWLGEHFTVSLAFMKPELDMFWTAGINHVIYQGVNYSPDYEDWPGWLFYAPVHFGPTNTWWRDVPALNSYVARTQAFLQSGRPANDVLLYWPVHDLWSGVYEGKPFARFSRALAGAVSELFKGDTGRSASLFQTAFLDLYESEMLKVNLFAVHNYWLWLDESSFGDVASRIWERGYAFDYVSDRMIWRSEVSQGLVVTEGKSAYSVIVVPPCRFMPVETVEKLVNLAKAGATVVFKGGFPEDAPGLYNLDDKRARLQAAMAAIGPREPAGSGVEVASIGRGKIILGDDLEGALTAAGVRRESIADHGIKYMRRSHEQGYHYFLANPGPNTFNGWAPLATPLKSAVIFDPLFGKQGVAAVRHGSQVGAEVYLQLEAGQSLILRTFTGMDVSGQPWQYLDQATEPYTIEGPWRLEFIEGGPAMPPPITVDRLESWTGFEGSEYRFFSGTGRYTIEFDLPDRAADEWMLELGEVRESARVLVNGRPAGTLFCHPFRLRAGELLKPGKNRIEIEVTNLAANRIIDLERRGVDWKKFHNINFVNVNYLPFNAASWKPFRSGLIGPVNLVPMDVINETYSEGS